MAELISNRAELARDWEDFFNKHIYLCSSNPYDEIKNPTGYVNLGTSVNNMCNDLIYPKITSNDVWSCDTTLLQYREGYGIMQLRKVFAKILTELLKAHKPVSPENIFCASGVTSCIDLLAHCLADPGDVFLAPTPLYGRIYTNLKQRALVDVWPIPIITADNTDDYPVLTLEKVQKAYDRAIAENRVVRGVFLINPNNPLGDIYSPQLLMDILSFCHKHSLHVIVDEVYALSVFSESQTFHSVLRIPDLPDPERTHVLYGLSKDFGIAGLRIGIIHTVCDQLQKCLVQLTFFQNIPFPMMAMTARYLEDLDWMKKFVAENQHRLSEKYNECANFLKEIGLNVRDSQAGFFLWVDFRHVCGLSFDEERRFFEYLINNSHLYIGPGQEFFCDQPGWFRIVFTGCPNHVKEGLTRLERALHEYS